MNILDYLNEKQISSQERSHPFCNTSSEFKFSYCYGLGTLAFGYKYGNPEAPIVFKRLLSKVQLKNVDGDKLIDSIRNNFDFKLQELFRTIRKKEEQYCFIGDLFYIANQANLSPTYSQDIINGYMDVFALDEMERTFLKRFCSYAAQKEHLAPSFQKQRSKKAVSSYYKSVDYDTEFMQQSSEVDTNTFISLARTLYRDFLDHGYFLPYQIVTYLFPSFSLKETFHSLQLNDGKTLTIDYPTVLYGTILIKNGSTLVIDHTKLQINGNIFVENGKVLIKNSDIKVEGCQMEYIFSVSDSTIIKIENSTVDCNFKTAFLNQKTGFLTLTNSHIKNTSNAVALNFTGYAMDLKNCSFDHCMAGGIFNDASKGMLLESCTFTNCNAEHGGALYSKSLSPSKVISCHFHSCTASYLGSCIYFVNKKYNQQVVQCTFELCSPSDSLVFNNYNEIIDTYSLYNT